jgi:hypothetical protein
MPPSQGHPHLSCLSFFRVLLQTPTCNPSSGQSNSPEHSWPARPPAVVGGAPKLCKGGFRAGTPFPLVCR